MNGGGAYTTIVSVNLPALVTGLAAKAPLASPAFTGAPTGPNPAAGNSSTQLATTAFVTALVQSIVGMAPAELDTLKEIADRLVADESTAAALASTVAGKLAKASNLSDLADVVAARNNLQLGAVALLASIAIGNVTGLQAALDAKQGTLAKASQAQAQAGTDDAAYMTPARTADAIAKLAVGGVSTDDFRSGMVQLARVAGKLIGLAGAAVDDFRDLTGIDTANSSAVAYNATAGTLSNKGVNTAEDLAVLTSNNTPSGQTANASSYSGGGYEAFRAFDGQASTYWTGVNNGDDIWRTSSAARREGAYALTIRADGGSYPVSWSRWGSNDGGTTKVVLDTQSGQVFTAGQRRVYTVPTGNRGSYTTYGLTINGSGSDGGTYKSVAAIESLLEVSSVLDLRSAAFTVQAQPAKGSLFFQVKATAGTITPGTNLLASLSRNNGGSWAAGTLVKGASIGGFDIYEANGIDLSGQPAGTSVRWRLQTVGTALAVELDAAMVQVDVNFIT